MEAPGGSAFRITSPHICVCSLNEIELLLFEWKSNCCYLNEIGIVVVWMHPGKTRLTGQPCLNGGSLSPQISLIVADKPLFLPTDRRSQSSGQTGCRVNVFLFVFCLLVVLVSDIEGLGGVLAFYRRSQSWSCMASLFCICICLCLWKQRPGREEIFQKVF